MAEKVRATLYNDVLAGGATVDLPLPLSDPEAFVVTVVMTNATASGDISSVDVFPVVNGRTYPTALTPEVIQAPALVSGHAAAIYRYDPRGLDGVEVSVVSGAGSDRDTEVRVASFRS